jgi:hypothetical protein
MGVTGDHDFKQSKPGSEKQSSHVEIDPKDKHIHKYKHDHI